MPKSSKDIIIDIIITYDFRQSVELYPFHMRIFMIPKVKGNISQTSLRSIAKGTIVISQLAIASIQYYRPWATNDFRLTTLPKFAE